MKTSVSTFLKIHSLATEITKGARQNLTNYSQLEIHRARTDATQPLLVPLL